MLAVVIGLILIVAVAVVIMVVVAAPRLREGEELLTPEGKQSITRATHVAREQSAAAAGNTANAVSSLRGKVSNAWTPASDFLHQQFDRLEGRPGVHSQQGGSGVVGSPRAVPAESGPIPIDDSQDHPDRQPDRQPESVSGSSSAVINLRADSPDEMKPQSAISPDTNRRLY